MKMNKFIAIQVDGLSHRKLLEASHNSLCPNLTELMKTHKVHKYNCGLPSNTPFAQAGIMYGKNNNIPGFTFVDKKMQKVFTTRNVCSVALMEEVYLGGKKGILENGRSYLNIFSGGAAYSRLTTSKVEKEFIRQFDILLMLLDPRIAAKVLYKTVHNTATLLEYLYEKISGTFKKYVQPSDFKYTVTRLFSSVIFEELGTRAAIRDMKQKVPRIYITYNGYDENSHHQGPSSPAAFKAVQTIDHKIGKIVSTNKKLKMPYDIFVLSDHGHTESVPFKKLYGKSFEKHIHSVLNKYHGKKHPMVAAEHKYSKMPRGIKNQMRQLSWNRHPYFVEISDPLANIYFNHKKTKVNYREIESLYPGFIKSISSHPGVGIVICNDDDKVRIINKYGEAIAGKSLADRRFKGERFLRNYGDEKTLIHQIQYFARMHNSGDLIIMGDYSKHNVVSFINHFGSHGSAGGEQMHPFFMTDKDVDLSKTINVADLYHVFADYG